MGSPDTEIERRRPYENEVSPKRETEKQLSGSEKKNVSGTEEHFRTKEGVHGEGSDERAEKVKIFPNLGDEDEQKYARQRKIVGLKEKEEADRLEREHQAEERHIADEKAAKKRKRTIIAIVVPIVVAFVVLLTTIIVLSPKYKEAVESQQQYKEAVEKYGGSIKAVSVGGTITFGHYEQDNNSANGKEEIEWIVLARDGDKVLAISKYALDCQQYNSSFTSVTWETCSLREWMNETFLKTAFNSGEQRLIQNSTVKADRNSIYSTSPGNDTTDKVFLLSLNDVYKYFSSDSARQCQGTAYCFAKGAYDLKSSGNCYWWLRSPGESTIYAAFVDESGIVYNSGKYVINDEDAVRPALWINLGSGVCQGSCQ